MLGIEGLLAPIVTPFTDGADSISEVRLARLVRHLRERGVAGFVVASETGEFTTITTAERKSLLEMVLREAQGLPVLAHCTRLGTAQALDLCQHAARHGARAAVVMPPYFGVYTAEEIEHHLRFISQHAGLPVIVVDPQHLIWAEGRERLLGAPNLIFAQSTEQSLHSRFSVAPLGPGSDEFVVDRAVVSPLIQIAPSGDEIDVKEIARMMANFGRTRVAKAALELMGIEVGPPRSPTLRLADQARQALATHLGANLAP